jgi:hypothetical protein|tara:strand:- start:2760 stop:3200 length:441 start_codon:yes stop_codon:yes gene_type:complete
MNSYSPGDIVEITTDKGLVYVHLTHEHPSYPPVVRLLKGVHAAQPDNIGDYARDNVLYTAMIPLVTALNRIGLSHRKVGELPLTGADRDFPVFRMPIRDKQGNIVYWWFWDGRGLTYSTELEEQQDTLPMREVMSGAAMVERLLAS